MLINNNNKKKKKEMNVIFWNIMFRIMKKRKKVILWKEV